MIYHYKGFPIPMMSLNFFYNISIMFHTNAMTCHGYSTNIEFDEFKASNLDGYKGSVSPCQSTLWWTNVPVWMGGYFD
jgi:hypothetical protein